MFLNGLEKRNFYFSMLIGNHRCTLCINFVRFSSAISEFKKYSLEATLLRRAGYTLGFPMHFWLHIS